MAGKIIRWEPAPLSTDDAGKMRKAQLQQQVMLATTFVEDSTRTALPSKQTHRPVDMNGGWVAKRHPGAE